jgi:allophanate hydrolase subunit 2
LSFTISRMFGVGAWRQLQSVPRRRFGVPVGGPWDREAAELALALLNQAPDHPVFEMLHGTVELEVDQPGTLSAVGADGRITIGEAVHPLGVRLPIEKGGQVCLQAKCAYLAWTPERFGQARLDWKPKSVGSLRYLPSEPVAAEFEVTVSPVSSRAGVRLVGLPPGDPKEQPSEPCCVGAIQQTPGGELLIIGPDGPTIGGYPRLGTIIEADLNHVPRLAVGQKVKIAPVTLKMALESGTSARERSFRLSRGLMATLSRP